MFEQNAVAAVYATHVDAEAAVKELQRSGIDMHTLSIVGKDSHTDEHVVGYYNTGDRMKYWGKTGAFWGGPEDFCGASFPTATCRTLFRACSSPPVTQCSPIGSRLQRSRLLQ